MVWSEEVEGGGEEEESGRGAEAAAGMVGVDVDSGVGLSLPGERRCE